MKHCDGPLLDPAAVQDAEERRLSLVLIGSLSSGNARNCELREKLVGLVFGKGH